MRRKNLRIVFRIMGKLFAFSFLLCVVKAGLLYYEQRQAEVQQEQLVEFREMKESEGFETTTELAELNEEYLGWLTVYGTEVNLPVVLGKDNEYYLDHDFYGNDSRYGCLFADCDTDVECDGNLLVYGHHMKNGSMFGSLGKFKKKDFFKEHGLVRWEQGEDIWYYEIFAVLIIPGYEEDEDYFPIRDYINELGEENCSRMNTELKERALLWRDVELLDTDKFLFLMTCDYTKTDGRLLLCARRW